MLWVKADYQSSIIKCEMQIETNAQIIQNAVFKYACDYL